MIELSVPPATPGIKIDHLATAECMALVHKSMDFGIKQRLLLEDLNNMPFIDLNIRSPLGRLLASRLKANNIQFQIVANVETYQMAKALVAHGAGVSIVDEITARSTGHKDVVARKLHPPLQIDIALLHVESAPLSIMIQRFVEHLKLALNACLKT